MTVKKPYFRTRRAVKHGHNSGYSSWAYIPDPAYAKDGGHYVRAYMLIQNDLQSIFEYIEPSDECLKAYSYRIHALLMRTCIEIEANFKAILAENICTTPAEKDLKMKHYRKVDVTHHLSSYEVMLPTWNGVSPVMKPFGPWEGTRGVANVQASLPWYQAYNQSKHDRHNRFKSANLNHLINAVAGLLVLISSQFGSHDFSAGPISLGVSGHDSLPMSPAIGSLFRIGHPSDWTDAELYDFDWSELGKQVERFDKFNYDLINC